MRTKPLPGLHIPSDGELRRRGVRAAAALLGLSLCALPTTRAQTAPVAEPPQTQTPAAQAASAPPAPVPSGGDDGWSIHGQSTWIDEGNFHFPSEYEGPNSFTNDEQWERTFSVSLFVARKLWDGAEAVFNPELFQGYGLSGTLGIGGFPSGEAIKAGFPNLHYNTSRLYVSQIMGLGGDTEKIESGADQVEETVDVDRLVFNVGKFAANDFFDGNAYSHDSRGQFLNWALLESGAWDEPGDVLGFTAGIEAEWNTKNGTLRYGLFMEPPVINSPRLDHHLEQAHGQILQYDIRYTLGSQSGTVRPFVYWNQANMGLFSAADAEAAPDISTVRAYRSKEGAGLSWDQALSANLGAFVRMSWNDGRTEDIAYADIDESIAAGLSENGAAWGRPDDTLGVAGVLDGLSPSHRQYLAEGGIGFILGDGALNYGTEEITEMYYSFGLWKHLYLSPDWQYIEHPGYNRDRGGVSVYTFRVHVEF